MNNYPTIAENSFDIDLTRTHKEPDNSRAHKLNYAPTLNNEYEKYRINLDSPLKASLSFVTRAACTISIVTAVAMPVETISAPSQISLFPSVSELINISHSDTMFPAGYEIINGNKIASYLKKHPTLKSFLNSNLDTFRNISGTENLSLEHDNMAEEGWEGLFLTIHLEDNDFGNINNIEEALFTRLLDDAPEDIINNLTVSFA